MTNKSQFTLQFSTLDPLPSDLLPGRFLTVTAIDWQRQVILVEYTTRQDLLERAEWLKKLLAEQAI